MLTSSTDPLIVSSPIEVNNQTSAILSCNLTNPPSTVKGHYWMRNGNVIEASKQDSAALYTEYM